MLPIINHSLQQFKTVFKESWKWRWGYVVIGGFIVARWLGALSGLELLTLDFFLKNRPGEGKDEDIVIVLINRGTVEGSDNLPDKQIIELLRDIFLADPAVVGLNIFRDEVSNDPQRSELLKMFETHPNLVGVQKALPPEQIEPIAGLPEETAWNQFGINDLPLDKDGRIRRVYVGAYLPDEDTDPGNNVFKFSFSFNIAEKYLAQQGFTLENFPADPVTPSFRNSKTGEYIKVPRVTKNFGGYVRTSNIADIQTVLNFRSGDQTFDIIDSTELANNPELLERLTDKIVIVGTVDSPVVPRFLPVATSSNLVTEKLQPYELIPQGFNTTPRLGILGSELEAHAVNQLIDSVLNERALIDTTHPLFEDTFIIFAGLIGIAIGAWSESTIKRTVVLILASGAILLICYISIYRYGIWLPVMPMIACLAVVGITSLLLNYRSQQNQLQSQQTALVEAQILEQERRKAIERAFSAIHAGPLQRLSSLLRAVKDGSFEQAFILEELRALNKEIRGIGERLRQEAIEDVYFVYSEGNIKLDLTHPMHEILYEVYSLCVQRKLPGFENVKVRSVSISPFDCKNLGLDVKRDLCWFLEESLQNIGKHALGTTKIQVIGKNIDNFYCLKIEDNGPGIQSSHIGEGTQSFYRLESILGGKFSRSTKPDGGTVCELTWPSS